MSNRPVFEVKITVYPTENTPKLGFGVGPVALRTSNVQGIAKNIEQTLLETIDYYKFEEQE